jgi:hypothetical protein
MSAVTQYFFDTVYFPRSAWRVVGWWEARRPAYNLAVGAAGTVTLLALGLLGLLPPLRALAVLVPSYAIMANVCYSAGPCADLLARRIGGPDWAPIGPTLLRYGFALSIGLTLLPIPVALVMTALQAIGVMR